MKKVIFVAKLALSVLFLPIFIVLLVFFMSKYEIAEDCGSNYRGE